MFRRVAKVPWLLIVSSVAQPTCSFPGPQGLCASAPPLAFRGCVAWSPGPSLCQMRLPADKTRTSFRPRLGLGGGGLQEACSSGAEGGPGKFHKSSQRLDSPAPLPGSRHVLDHPGRLPPLLLLSLPPLSLLPSSFSPFWSPPLSPSPPHRPRPQRMRKLRLKVEGRAWVTRLTVVVTGIP